MWNSGFVPPRTPSTSTYTSDSHIAEEVLIVLPENKNQGNPKIFVDGVEIKCLVHLDIKHSTSPLYYIGIKEPVYIDNGSTITITIPVKKVSVKMRNEVELPWKHT